MIEQSIAKQYGIIPSEQEDLSWPDWCKLVGGLMEDTPLGRVVSIRAETDRDTIRRFTPDQRRIRAEWDAFRLEKMTGSKNGQLGLQMVLAAMCGEKVSGI